MPSKPLRPCRHPGCRALTRTGWCPEHQPRPRDTRTPQPWRRWYSLPIWTQRLRPDQLAREPFCRFCAARGLRVRATDVDHIRDHKGDWSLFADPANLESLCHRCHSRKTAAEMGRMGRKSGGV